MSKKTFFYTPNCYHNDTEPRLGNKLTLEEVERVVSAHEGGQLKPGGDIWVWSTEKPQGCIMQILANEPNFLTALHLNRAVGVWFDMEYKKDWTAEELIRALDKAGAIE